MFIDWDNFLRHYGRKKDVTAENVEIQIRGNSKNFTTFIRFWEFYEITVLMEKITKKRDLKI